MKLLYHPNMLQMIYMAFIYSRINYCLLVWGTLTSQTESNNIKVLQNACRRIFPNGTLKTTNFIYVQGN